MYSAVLATHSNSLLFGSLLILVTVVAAELQYDDELSSAALDAAEPSYIQRPAGYDVRLNCGLTEQHAVFLNQSTVHWHFKRCERRYNHLACDDPATRSREWSPLACGKVATDKCQVVLVLERPGEAESGLYRCSVQPYRPDDRTTLQIQMVKAYQLDIINLTIATPQILDNLPANTSTTIGAQVVMQCRVRSKVIPTIKWFRKQEPTDLLDTADDEAELASFSSAANGDDEPKDGELNHRLVSHNATHHSLHHSGRIVQFLDNSYENLESAGEKGLPNDTYLSKLIFPRVGSRDAGTYVCVAINYRGYTLREAVLDVFSPDAVDSLQSSETGRTQLMLLFLIPLALAAMPLLMWACYLMCRSRRSRERAEAARRAKQSAQQGVRKYSLVCQNEIYV